MEKRKTGFLNFLVLILVTCTIVSCQKEIDGTSGGGTVIPVPSDQKPKVGTTWTYRYEWYNTPGGLVNTKMVYHKAKSEETLGGEKWLKIVDIETDTVVYYLATKNDGLYQYTNNNSYLLCKYPASVNDTYTTFNTGTVENFTVRTVDETIATGLGDIKLTKYEGVKPSDPRVIDVIWYNKNSWITWRWLYKLFPVAPNPPVYVLYSRLYIDNIVY
ncbi:MAG: hypothetical protein WAR80_08755 [Ferruginibacter sp.]